MHTLTYKKDSQQVSALRIALVMTIGYFLLVVPDLAFAQMSSGDSKAFDLKGLDDVLCGAYKYLAKKVLFYVALIVTIVAIVAYLMKLNKEVWGTMFIVAVLLGVAQGVGPLLATLGGFNASLCSA
jgi:hypothetical protein